jgi:hypothetical protein
MRHGDPGREADADADRGPHLLYHRHRPTDEYCRAARHRRKSDIDSKPPRRPATLATGPADGERPTPERCVEAYYLQRTRFESIAERKLRRRQLTEDGDVEISGRDLGKNSSVARRRSGRSSSPMPTS